MLPEAEIEVLSVALDNNAWRKLFQKRHSSYMSLGTYGIIVLIYGFNCRLLLQILRYSSTECVFGRNIEKQQAKALEIALHLQIAAKALRLGVIFELDSLVTTYR